MLEHRKGEEEGAKGKNHFVLTLTCCPQSPLYHVFWGGGVIRGDWSGEAKLNLRKEWEVMRKYVGLMFVILFPTTQILRQ